MALNERIKDMSIFSENIESTSEIDFIEWELLKGQTLLITGATGLIGHAIIKILDYVNKELSLNMHVLALVRDEVRAKERFSDLENSDMIEYLVGCVENLPDYKGDISYIIHGASQTSSREFVVHPVETIRTSVEGTKNVLELARKKKVKSFVYMSSMEVYGYPEKGHRVKEHEIGAFSSLNLRNSYPISKILCENMCCAYSSEYGVPAKIIRLTQTFGEGVNYNDNRIFAYFGRCIKEKNDIVLKTKGETERCYLYTYDAVTAILCILLYGEKAQAYNAADEKTYCSIAEMAEMLASDAGINVVYDIQPLADNGFPETLFMYLDTSKLRGLGWKPIGGYPID